MAHTCFQAKHVLTLCHAHHSVDGYILYEIYYTIQKLHANINWNYMTVCILNLIMELIIQSSNINIVCIWWISLISMCYIPNMSTTDVLPSCPPRRRLPRALQMLLVICLGPEATLRDTNIPINILVHKEGLWALVDVTSNKYFWAQDIREIFYQHISKPQLATQALGDVNLRRC